MGGRLCCSHHDPLQDSVRRPFGLVVGGDVFKCSSADGWCDI